MEVAGNDGAIKHVIAGVKPQGCQVFSFGHPSEQELDHDFLWRTTLCTPERGHLGSFNHSYYEEVLVTRVHPELLAGEHLQDKESKHDDFWHHRHHLETMIVTAPSSCGPAGRTHVRLIARIPARRDKPTRRL